MRVLLLFLFIAAAASIASIASSSSNSNVDGEQALLDFMAGIDKDPSESLRKSWVRGTLACPSTWQGVSCDDKGRVSGLDLSGLALSGSIKAATLSRLSALASLSLGSNLLTGSLPPDLGKLSNLQQLDVSNNMLSGSIPETFQGLGSLVNLSLASNGIGGSIPDMFQGMPSLQQLALGKNNLTGVIPDTIVSLKSLSLLDLSCNQLNGSIPGRLDMLHNLEQLDLHANRLSGPIGDSWMSLEKLQRVDLSSNLLSGELPWLQLLLPSNLVYVNLSSNRVSGLLAPENAASLFANKIQVLDVSNNQLSGSLPSFEFVFSLRTLRLSRNRFTGFVPPALLSTDASLLEELDLSQNSLSGNVWAISAARLSLLNLSSNMLSGGLPPRLGSCASVDLSNNMFSGNLSVMKTWGNSLETVNLSNNSLTGVLPNETAQLLRLISLDVSHNRLSGAIPPTFASFPKLTSLDLSANSLTSSIPSSFFFSSSLARLKLSNNQLTGGIPLDDALATSAVPDHLNSLPYSPLRLLDISANQLNGSIPQKLVSISTLELLNLSQNRLSGNIPADIKQLEHLQQLDLSSNLLTGSIPSTFPASMRSLNLSSNKLSGSIPSQLERQFPPSAFYPGNAELQSDGFTSWNGSPQANEPKGHLASTARNKKVSPAFKAGIIGGCSAAFVLVALLTLLVYYRRSAKAQEKSSAPVFRIVERDTLPQKAPTVVVATGSKEAPAPGPREDVPGFFSSYKAESSVENSVSVKLNSPDKLAGDLFLLDNDVIFTAEELSRAPAEVLGRSSQGTSYKATLDSGHTITVKWLKEGLAKSKKEFTTEAKKFGVIRHANILPLRGYYWGPREHEKLILTDYIAYGSLADRLTERTSRSYPPLAWQQRLRLAADVAQGLSYLHNEHKMAHGNLKASNVLLDGPELQGRLTDYGLHRLMTSSGTASQILNAGALGYRAPELSSVKRPRPSPSSDVYAYGVLLLEIVTGKGAGDIITGNSGAVDLPDWVRFLMADNRTAECFDRLLQEAAPPQIQQVLQVALKCISECTQRPAIKSVYEEIAALCSSA